MSSYYTRSSARLQQQLMDTTPTYNTRFQNRLRQLIPLDNTFDFDEASRLWNENKRRDGQMYSYVCIAKCNNNNQCKNKPISLNDYCKCHQNSV